MTKPHLPIDDSIPQIHDTLKRTRVVVLTAEPGTGKSTRVPPALVDGGPVILLQPRRVAARSLARRIAAEQGWSIGREVGWHVRFDRKFTADTRLLVATEGILTARLQSDPLLSEFHTVILDEFHERSVYADLAIALVRQTMEARDDLRLVVMSATLEVEPLLRYLPAAEVISVPGRTFPIDIAYRSDDLVAAVRDITPSSRGHVLCFLPGAREIDVAADALRGLRGAEVRKLHGSLPADEQDLALAPSPEKKIVLATNIAETSLTIDGVTDVIDSGLHKILRYDPEHGIDRLVLERIPADSAAQRAGRAGRTSAGRAVRLWDERLLLRAHREPEILRIDLARVSLEIIAWGGDPRTFGWFERPAGAAIDSALALLKSLGAIDDVRLTAVGRKLHALPLHPRVGRFFVETNASLRARVAAALLEEGRITSIASSRSTSESDLLVALDAALPARSREIRDERLAAIARQLERDGEARADDDDIALRRATFAAFPDRVARRRAAGSDQFLLASGTGARLSRDSSVHTAEWIVALDLGALPDGTALIRAASAVDGEWLRPTSESREHFLSDDGRVRAIARRMYGEIVMREGAAPVDAESAERLIAQELLKQLEGDDLQQIVRRARFAGVDVDWEEVARNAAVGQTSVRAANLTQHLPYDVTRTLDREAPTSIEVPSGRRARLEYNAEGGVELSVKLQELFGLSTTPTIGSRKVPVTILLLAPSGRPVQTTRDLASFWKNTYPEVRKELRGRYPKHPWPEDPTTATPTHKTKRRI